MLFFVFFLALSANCQVEGGYYQTGYVFLKNGSVIKGKYIYSLDLSKIQIVNGKNTFVFDASEVESISNKRPDRQFQGDEADSSQKTIPPSKFFNITEMGVLAGNPDNDKSAPFILGTSFNYTFWQGLSGGAGVGVEFYQETYLPVSLNLMYKFRQTRFTPFAGIQAGYLLPLEDSRVYYDEVIPDDIYWSSSLWPGNYYYNQTPLEARGGILFNPSVGFISQFPSGYGFSFSIGYRFHRLVYRGEDIYKLDVDYNRLSVKLGLIIN